MNKNVSEAYGSKEKAIMVFSIFITASILYWVLWYCRYGFEFSDESFYFIWMSNPSNYSVSTTQFGFIYHPLYKLLNGNIATLRQFNFIITYCLSWILVNVFLKTIFFKQNIRRLHRIVISSAIATMAAASFVSNGVWLPPTPSYNTLNLQALLIVGIGLLMANKNINRISVIGWFLIGLGGWLDFMAKPTTATALGICVCFYLLFSGKTNVRLLFISIITTLTLVILSALVIDGSILSFINRIKDGMEMLFMLDPVYTKLFRFDKIYFSAKFKFVLVTYTSAVFFATYFSQSKVKILIYSATILSVLFGLISLAIILGITHKEINGGDFQGLFILSIPLTSILLGLSISRFKYFSKVSRAQYALIFILFMLPCIYAFGTNNNYWRISPCSGIFWVLAGLVFLSPVTPSRAFSALLLPIGLAVQMLSVIQVHNGLELPYRQPRHLHDNNYRLDVGNPGSTLMLSRGFAKYIEAAVDLANQSRFSKGTPMIDFTGISPGILYAIGANSIAQPWMIGGYNKNSDLFVVAALKKATCKELATAWLLIEPNGPCRISPDVLLSFGANLTTDYRMVGEIKVAEDIVLSNKVRTQQILKPIRPIDEAMTACSTMRNP